MKSTIRFIGELLAGIRVDMGGANSERRKPQLRIVGVDRGDVARIGDGDVFAVSPPAGV
jgi:hypothetical protein